MALAWSMWFGLIRAGGGEPGAAFLPIGAALIVWGIYLVNRAPADEKLGRR
jgi:hypothetical protein